MVHQQPLSRQLCQNGNIIPSLINSFLSEQPSFVSTVYAYKIQKKINKLNVDDAPRITR